MQGLFAVKRLIGRIQAQAAYVPPVVWEACQHCHNMMSRGLEAVGYTHHSSVQELALPQYYWVIASKQTEVHMPVYLHQPMVWKL